MNSTTPSTTPTPPETIPPYIEVALSYIKELAKDPLREGPDEGHVDAVVLRKMLAKTPVNKKLRKLPKKRKKVTRQRSDPGSTGGASAPPVPNKRPPRRAAAQIQPPQREMRARRPAQEESWKVGGCTSVTHFTRSVPRTSSKTPVGLTIVWA